MRLRSRLFGFGWCVILGLSPALLAILVGGEIFLAVEAPNTGGLVYKLPMASLLMALILVWVAESSVASKLWASALTVLLSSALFFVSIVALGFVGLAFRGFTGVQ